MDFKTGLNLSPEPPSLRFAVYLTGDTLPPVPAVFGHQGLFPPATASDPFPWGLLANGSVGDCTIAGAMHCSMLWNKIAGRTVKFTDADAIDDYTGAGSGYPPNDNGLDMVTLAAYWKNTGIRDNTDTRHKLGAYLAMDYTNFDHILAASYLFDGGVGLGIAVPPNAVEQFEAGQPWTDAAPPGAPLHFVPLFGRDSQGLNRVGTWGRDHGATDNFLTDNLREVVAYVSQESLINQKSPEGFDWTTLIDNLLPIVAR